MTNTDATKNALRIIKGIGPGAHISSHFEKPTTSEEGGPC